VYQQVCRWFRVALYLGPMVVLCGWVGNSALPSPTAKERADALCSAGASAARIAQPGSALLRKVRGAPGDKVEPMPGMPPILDPGNLYSGAAADRFSPTVVGAPPRVYVPNRRSNSVYVIDPATLAVVGRFAVGVSPQHVVPSWDLKTLWVANNGTRRSSGSLTSIDPKTGTPGDTIPVDDPYNLYFTPDGRSAIVVAERKKRLDFRDPHTMALQQSISTPSCSGINHADFSIDGRYAIFTCEFRGGGLVKIDLVNHQVIGYLRLSQRGMPQDIRPTTAAQPSRREPLFMPHTRL
jgi:YVTN family beta-propeller protein